MDDMQRFIADAELSILDARQLDTPTTGQWRGHPTWQLTIVKRGNEYPMPLTFHLGQGDTRAPSLAMVLDCIASDVAGYRNADSFREWCDEYGYVPGYDAEDSPDLDPARIYAAVAEQARNLSNLLLDPELEDRLLWETERL